MVAKKGKKKAASKPVVKAAAVAKCPETCCSGKRCGVWKKIFVFVLGVIVGAAACCALGKKCYMKKMMKGRAHHAMKFDANGCLDLSKIKSQKKLEMIQAKVGGKECITKADLFDGEKPEGKVRMKKKSGRGF